MGGLETNEKTSESPEPLTNTLAHGENIQHNVATCAHKYGLPRCVTGQARLDARVGRVIVRKVRKAQCGSGGPTCTGSKCDVDQVAADSAAPANPAEPAGPGMKRSRGCRPRLLSGLGQLQSGEEELPTPDRAVGTADRPPAHR
jgi:hypothetical protein